MHINRQTYEEFFLLYADDELTPDERRSVEEFVDQNPDLANDFNLIRETIMHPDESIIFENKELLLKEDSDKKVILLRWFRYSAAAVLLIAFSITGWLFIGDKDMSRKPVAIVEKPVPVNSTENTSPKETKKGDEIIDEQSKNKNNIKSSLTAAAKKERQFQNISNKYSEKNENWSQTKDIKRENDISETEAVNDLPDRFPSKQEIVKSESPKETIDVVVSPREVENEEVTQPRNAYFAQSYTVESNSNDIIYFANTSLTKKTKLRGVLRKATRYLDRVTSLQ